MTEDIVPKLNEAINKAFDSRVKNDKQMQKAFTGDESIDLGDVSLLARKMGGYAYEALKECLTDDVLPDGILYWNIAQRTIEPLMRKVHELVCQMADAVQIREDKKLKIGIKPVHPEFNTDRLNDILNKVTSEKYRDTDGQENMGNTK